MPEFRGKKVTNARILAKSGAASRWRSFALYRTQVDDEGITSICQVAQKLEEIHLTSNLITDAAMPALCALPNLRSLLVDDVPQITDEGIAYVPRSSQLRELYLNGTQLSDAGVDAILNCRQIWSLCLDGTKITDAGVAKLGVLPNLRLVSFRDTLVEGWGARDLPDAERTSLYLERCPVSVGGLLAYLETHRKIELLSLNDTRINDEAMSALAALPAISDLRLEGTVVTDAGVERLLGHPSLMTLYLGRTAVSEKLVRQLENKSPQELTVYWDGE